jgi:hypothetical protein
MICTYEYVDGSGNEGRVRRTRPAPRNSYSAQLDKAPRSNVQNTPRPTVSVEPPPDSRGSAPSGHLGLQESWASETHRRLDLGHTGYANGYMSSHASYSAPLQLVYGPDLVGPLDSLRSRPRFSGDPDTDAIPGNSTPAPVGSIRVIRSSWVNELEGADPAQDADHDPERIQALICRSPNMDKNVKENSLPFVLQWCE